jgi:hypothetical protein
MNKDVAVEHRETALKARRTQVEKLSAARAGNPG